MAQYVVNFIISVPIEGRIAQMGNCCQIDPIDAPSEVSAFEYPNHGEGREGVMPITEIKSWM